MASPELQRLWQLAQVDQAIESIKLRAAALDIGQKLAVELKKYEQAGDEATAESTRLRTEQTEIELQQRGIDDKIAKFTKQMFGGTVVNAREAENLEKEIAALKRQRASFDERLLELFELVPPAEKKSKLLLAKIAELKQAISDRRKHAMEEKAQLESEFKRLTQLRPKQAEAVKDPALLARYETSRQRHAGVGMAPVTRQHSCGGCGTELPERSLEMLKLDKVVACDSCHRLLYYSEGII